MPTAPHNITAAKAGCLMLLAVWRMVRIFGLICNGLLLVKVRFPALGDSQREAVIAKWAGQVLRVLGIDVLATGTLHEYRSRGLLLVANHISWLDIIVLQAICPQARFVAKSEVRDWPLVGTLVTGTGALFVDRQRPRATLQLISEMVGLLRCGGTVIVFPEGTTSDGRQILPFHASLLQAAHQAPCVAQAVALRYSESSTSFAASIPYIDNDWFVGSLWRVCSARGVSVTVQWLDAHEANADRRELAHRLRTSIVVALGAGG